MNQNIDLSQEKMNLDIDTEPKSAASNMFSSKVELSKFLGSLDVLPDAYHAILETSLAYQLHTSPSGIQILAFKVPLDHTTRFLNGEFDLVSSESHNVVDFISTKGNPLFCINKAAVDLFEHLIPKLLQLEAQLTYKPLVVTGQSLGGYLAILFTLWLQHAVDMKESNGYRNNKRPLCITFGSPLLGDAFLQRAICERPIWNSCILNVVAKKDPIASYFSSNTLYKPFGTFLFYTESGGNSTFDDQEAILAALDSMAPWNAINLKMHDYKNGLAEVRRKILYRGASELGELHLNSLRTGITLQVEEVGLLDSEDLIGRMEKKQAKMIRSKNTYEPIKKVNEMKMGLVYLEWYMKTQKSNGGYYDSYKSLETRESIERRGEVTWQKRKLNQYWIKFVNEKRLMPQQEGGKLRKRWLYDGTNYRRIVEPLDIADHYKIRETNYIETRPDHYTLLEMWSNEDKMGANPIEGKKNKADSLTEDSCFWAHVEEALILVRDLRKGGGSSNIVHRLEVFEAYLMRSINDFLVSPDIFLENSSLMKWWKEYREYRGSSYASELAKYMNNKNYISYQ